MDYQNFKVIFNSVIFDKSKIDLIKRIAESPDRYLGLFRPTTPKAKILQNILQSNEIRFGDAFETLIENYVPEMGYLNLEKDFITAQGDRLNIDQCFQIGDKVFFIEQKIRDDHDSTKKRGQIHNFEQKLNALLDKYNEKKILGIIYFIDPTLSKNKNYYQAELDRMKQDYGVDLYLLYGKELFSYFNQEGVWNEILNYLTKWKEEIPDLPETNFDINYQNTFQEIKDLSPAIFRKLFSNDDIFKEILTIIFPEKKTLFLLLEYFKTKANEKTIYRTLSNELEARLIL